MDFDRIIDRRASDSNKWHKFPPDVLPLWVADMDFESPRAVIEALRARVQHGIFGYLREQHELPEIVAERVAKRHGWRVSPEAVVALPGVIPGLNQAARALTMAGDGLLVQTPVYPPILRVAGNHGLTREEAELAHDATGRYTVDLEGFARAIGARTRLFVLCHPHNPVGRSFRRDELEGMAAECLRRDLWIIADEIHCDVLFDGRQHVPIASLAPEVEERTLTFMAPSKTFNLPGLKCAVAIVPNASLRAKFVAAASDLVPKINVLGYTAAVAAYREGDGWLEELLRYLESNRDFLAGEVARHLPGIILTPPEATYLAWLDCRQAAIPGGDPYTFFLERARVALNDGRTFGRGGDGFVRLNFGSPRAMLVDGLDRMRAALAAARG
ncbi:MAG TPA: PatB family C-S lyase [Methylomirabilota bacterium]|jgi:cystathionine beta-lyase|nr:PatB family C-S lyase [Methylomirabilota bacterium]